MLVGKGKKEIKEKKKLTLFWSELRWNIRDRLYSDTDICHYYTLTFVALVGVTAA